MTDRLARWNEWTRHFVRVLLLAVLVSINLLHQDAFGAGSTIIEVQGGTNGRVAVGGEFVLSWRARRPVPEQGAALLVLEMPPTVRLSGDGFLALGPGSPMPFGLDASPDLLRVVIPRSLLLDMRTGKVHITPLAAGSIGIKASEITIGSHGEVVSSRQVWKRVLRVPDNHPIIQVDDRAISLPPESMTLSPDGRYELWDRGSTFQVFGPDRGHILERVGTLPAFSPTSRFLTYFTDEEEKVTLRLIDLLAVKEVGEVREIDSFGCVVAWSPGDSFVVLGTAQYGGVGVLPTFRDGKSRIATRASCHACSAWDDARIGIDLENGVVRVSPKDSFFGDLREWSLFEGHRLAPPLNGDGDWVQTGVRALFGIGPKLDASRARTQLPFPKPPPRRWELGGRLRVSQLAGGEGDWAKQFLVKPGLLAARPALPSGDLTGLTQHGIPISRGIRPIDSGPLPGPRPALARRLEEFGFAVRDVQEAPVRTNWQREVPDVKALLGRLARIDERFRSQGLRPFGANGEPNCFPHWDDNEVLPTSVSVKAWPSLDAPRIVLFQSFCSGGGASGVGEGTQALYLASPEGPRWLDLAQTPSSPGLASTRDGWDLSAENDTNAFLSDDGRLLLASRLSRVILVVDTQRGVVESWIANAVGLDDLLALYPSADARAILQVNRNGRLHVYGLRSGERQLSGFYGDDEIVFYDDDGCFDGTEEGAQFISWHFLGTGQHHPFSQFASTFRHPDRIRAAMEDRPVAHPPQPVDAPPELVLDVTRDPANEGRFVAAATADGPRPVRRIQFFADGAPIADIGSTGHARTGLEVPRGMHWVSARATDDRGHYSRTLSVALSVPDVARPPGILRYVGIGINRYPMLPGGSQLAFARRDVEALQESLVTLTGERFRGFQPRSLLDEQATAGAMLTALESAIRSAQPDDVVIVYFAGHGARGQDGRFYFLGADADSAAIERTGLAWDQVASILTRTPARVLVLLDACHAGVAGRWVAENEEVQAPTASKGKAGIAVLAASKGRQPSLEMADLDGGHGVFNAALLHALGEGRSSADIDQNGLLDLDELHRSVRTFVLRHTGGRQTPFISRNEIVGPFPLF